MWLVLCEYHVMWLHYSYDKYGGLVTKSESLHNTFTPYIEDCITSVKNIETAMG